MLRITFKTNPEVIDVLRRKGSRVVQVLESKVTQLMFLLGAFVQREKLSGQILTPRTGKLRASVTVQPTTISGTKISGSVTAAGSVAFYGKFHEEGTSHVYQVLSSKKKALSFLLDGKQRAFAHITHPAIKQRAFMAPSLEENKMKIVTELEAALRDVANEK